MNTRLLSLLSCIMLMIAMQSCRDLRVPPGELLAPGTIVESIELGDYDVDQVDSILEAEFGPLAGLLVTPTYGVSIHTIIYKTPGLDGKNKDASGIVIIPNSPDPLPILSLQHGTVNKKDNVPTQNATQRAGGMVLGTDGFIVCIPDLLGLGLSEGLHPYLHAKTEAMTSRDLIRACREICATREVELNEQLFLVGYSQGGHATMALHRELEENHSEEFTITASAPMAGPYSMSGIMVDKILSEEEYGSPSYLPYVVFAYNEAYDLYNEPADYFKEKYAKLLPVMLDGSFTTQEIDAILPDNPTDIMLPEVLEKFIEFEEDHPLRIALRDNDLIDWLPKAPMKLYHCSGDELVPYANSELAYNSFTNKGATDIELIDMGIFSHGQCATVTFFDVRTWFNDLRE